jgi:hypothetical protein
MFSVLRHPRQFYQDQLYNPHAGDLGMWDFYQKAIPSLWRVYGSAENDPVSKIHGSAAFSCLAAAHRLPYTWYWHPGVLTTPAFHRIPVLACGHYIDSYVTSLSEPTWVRSIRIRVFKVIRVHVCRQWLARARIEIRRADWCDDVIANVIIEQLEAWFATVPHEEVQWSEYDDWLRRFRVIQW